MFSGAPDAPFARDRMDSRANDKIRQAYDRLRITKLSALKKLAAHIGMIFYRGSPATSKEKIATLYDRDRHGWMVIMAMLVILDEKSDPISRAASDLILECFAPNWKSRVPPEIVGMVVERNHREVANWRKQVLTRDGHKCVDCGSPNELHAHHIARWADFPSLRVVLDNGLTLCRPCHERVHATA